MRPVLAILGGSTPFTAALVEALLRAPHAIPPCELRLYGRDRDALSRMERYATARLGSLGWTALGTACLDEAVDGAHIVVNQIRFGGLEARARDEALASAFELPADETLGPGALACALRTVKPLRALAAELGRRCPDAWVLNLVNPLSVTTAEMVRAGAPRRCLGVCELPLATVLEACRVLRMSASDVAWDYAGLNHRGFVFSLRHRGEEVVHQLADLLHGDDIFGITAAEVRRAGALPLKYFTLGQRRAAPPGRAEFLIGLKHTLERQLDASDAPPTGLRARRLDWYEGAVVPAIEAIFAAEPRRLVVNTARDDGLVRELPALVSQSGCEVVHAAPPAHLAPWLDSWEAHERAVLEAVQSPGLDRVEHTLSLDPLVPHTRVRELARAIWTDHEH